MSEITQRPVVLLLGATGLFGELLATRLLRQGRVDLVCAARNEKKLKAFCDKHGGRYVSLDRDDPDAVARVFEDLKPFATMDCAGPFQAYGEDPYKFARAAIEAGSHVFDIADAVEFVEGISELDALAKQKNLVVLSGASTTPAISSTVADELTKDLKKVSKITTAIVPGNKARRTLSVMRSILGQIGQPFFIYRNGKDERVYGWSEAESFDLKVEGKPFIKARLASLVDTPDNRFLAKRYEADTVEGKAGLEVRLFHHAMGLGGRLVRLGAVKSLEPFTGFVRWTASWFEWMGSDAGGMKVSVLGKDKADHYQRLEWDLIADDGNGPNIPTLPISILLNRLLDGESIKSGARPCLGEVSLEELDVAFSDFGGKAQVNSCKAMPVFQTVLGDAFSDLPEPVRALHSNFGKATYAGRASVKGATGLLGRIASRLVGFPSEADDTAVRVTITSDDKSEVWRREFGGRIFHSHLGVDEEGYAQERFGPLVFRLGLKCEDGKLYFPVSRARLFGVMPIPGFLLPQSIAHESVDEEGRFVFDVLIRFRFGGRIAHYQGWLERLEG
jgi:hypothetical protein